MVVRDRLPRSRIMLASLCFALFWYYFSSRVIWKAMSPLISLLHVEPATILGHLVYGTALGRFPLYLPGPQKPASDDGPGGTETS